MAAEEQPALAGTKAQAPAAVPAKVLAIAVPVIVAGTAALAYAVFRYVGSSPSAKDLAELAGLFVSMAVAERFPVPVKGSAPAASPSASSSPSPRSSCSAGRRA